MTVLFHPRGSENLAARCYCPFEFLLFHLGMELKTVSSSPERKKLKSDSSTLRRWPDSVRSRLWRVGDDTLLSEEQSLARWNLSVWQKIEECQQKVHYYQSKLNALYQSIAKEHAQVLTFTRLACDDEDHTIWNSLPPEQQFDPDVVRFLIKRVEMHNRHEAF